MNKNLKWLTAIFSALLIGGVIAPPIIEYIIPSNGNIKATGSFNYYFNDILNPSNLDWGPMDSGSTYFVVLKITSTCTAPLIVNLTANLPTGWAHAWNLNNTIWNPSETKEANYELTPFGTPGNYTWNTIITATEA